MGRRIYVVPKKKKVPLKLPLDQTKTYRKCRVCGRRRLMIDLVWEYFDNVGKAGRFVCKEHIR